MRFLCVVMLAALWAPTASAAEALASDKAIRAEVQAVERSIDRRFRDVRDATPMAMLGTTRGFYLKGHGTVFTLELNLSPIAGLSPFRQSYSEEEKRQLNIRKRQRLETLEQKAREILIEESAKLTLLPVEETVTLAVSLFHFGWEDLTRLPSQLVMGAVKQVLDQGRAGMPAADLKQQIEVGYF